MSGTQHRACAEGSLPPQQFTAEATTFTTESNMGARTLYPAPPCPECGNVSRVYNTAYTEDGRILRNRQCSWCGHSWWTLQTPEQSIDPEKQRVVLPKSFTSNKHLPARLLKLEPCTPSPSSSA